MAIGRFAGFLFCDVGYRFCGREEKSRENRGRAMPFLPLRSNDNGRTREWMSIGIRSFLVGVVSGLSRRRRDLRGMFGRRVPAPQSFTEKDLWVFTRDVGIVRCFDVKFGIKGRALEGCCCHGVAVA